VPTTPQTQEGRAAAAGSADRRLTVELVGVEAFLVAFAAEIVAAEAMAAATAISS